MALLKIQDYFQKPGDRWSILRSKMFPESLRERVESFDTEDLPNFLYTVILVTNAMLHLGIFPPLV